MKCKNYLYKVTKKFRGGEGIHYIKVNPKMIGDSLARSIGGHTNGGHCDGYEITFRKVKKLPKGTKLLSKFYAIY